MNRRFFRCRVVRVAVGIVGASAFVLPPNDGCTGNYDMLLPGQATPTVGGFADDPALYGNNWDEFSAGVDTLLDELNSL